MWFIHRLLSSEILSQLIKGTPEISAEQISNIDNESIEIILARVGKALSDDDKKSIIEKIKKKNIAEEDRFLMYFINKLVEIYEEQRKLDNKVKSYINICNEYLSHSKKSIVYSESEVEFYIKSFLYKEEKLLINFLNKLSSGEKQILSLFAKIYLTDNDEEFVVLFDEPELSLSIYWQEKLLPDIANSGKCKTLIAVTHSPFIYDNDLKEYANGLNEYLAVKVDN